MVRSDRYLCAPLLLLQLYRNTQVPNDQVVCLVLSKEVLGICEEFSF